MENAHGMKELAQQHWRGGSQRVTAEPSSALEGGSALTPKSLCRGGFGEVSTAAVAHRRGVLWKTMLKNIKYVCEMSRNAKQGNSSLDRESLSRDIQTRSSTENNQTHRKHKPHVRTASQSSMCSTRPQQAELLCQLSSAPQGSLTPPSPVFIFHEVFQSSLSRWTD